MFNLNNQITKCCGTLFFLSLLIIGRSETHPSGSYTSIPSRTPSSPSTSSPTNIPTSTSTEDLTNTPTRTPSISSDLMTMVPAEVFDLDYWKITLPLDEDNDNRADEVSVSEIRAYSHPDYFYLDKYQHMVFAAPNLASTTANSSNTRSELRQMLRGTNKSIGTSDPGNNFSLAVHEYASEFGAVGGRMEATLKVDHVAVNTLYMDKLPVYSVVVGQIHAVKLDDNSNGFGWGNEPLKIYFKKFPEHDYGSIFWTYERNLTKEDPNRTDIAYPVWGNTWENSDDPGGEGIALGEEFSYVVNVYENIMYLTFEAANHDTVEFQIDLSNNIDAYGNIDTVDFAKGYSGDSLYFKAGAYNQCNVNTDEGFWSTACNSIGVWGTDYANGDYVQVTFSKLILSEAACPVE